MLSDCAELFGSGELCLLEEPNPEELDEELSPDSEFCLKTVCRFSEEADITMSSFTLVDFLVLTLEFFVFKILASVSFLPSFLELGSAQLICKEMDISTRVKYVQLPNNQFLLSM